MKRNAKNGLPCTCQQCGKTFYAARITAKFCPGGKCKTAYHREKQKTGGHTWHDVNPQYFDKYHLIKSMSDDAAIELFSVLTNDGAKYCEKAIDIAYMALIGCLKSEVFNRDQIKTEFGIIDNEEMVNAY